MDEALAFEIDFHPVGDGEKGGDAIIIKYGRLNSENNFSQKVIVVDGGTLNSGKQVVEHIKNVYKTNTVDLIINTRPDKDHCSGLREVINNLTIKEIWIHLPWLSSSEFLNVIKDGRIANNSLKERLKDALNVVSEIESLAKSKRITLKEPFTGLTFDGGVVTVLGPTETFYKELLPRFRSTPVPANESLLSKAFSSVKVAVQMVAEAMHIETLDESGETSPENNTSVISLFSYAGQKVLFAGDAGIPALKQVIDIADYNNIALNELHILQVPHHGSKRNVSPGILNSIKAECAYISCPKEGDPKHPAKKVTNALIRRGMNPFVTKGNILYRRYNTPWRADYYSATPIPFYNQVEE